MVHRWCYRVGMRLRSAVVTSVYSKALVLNAGVLSRRATGEITNLMAIDSTRLQELTPYLHAIWYSFFQVTSLRFPSIYCG
jgi:ATP-binding cassette subfamily C (CFTR/MRP) protein 1